MIAVVIQNADARGEGLGKVFLAGGAGDVQEADAGPLGNLLEAGAGDGRGRGGRSVGVRRGGPVG